MRGRGPGRWLLGVVGALSVALALAGGWLPGGLELRIELCAGNVPLVVVPLEPGEHFTIRYVHSVDHAPIWEEHSADRGGVIHLEEERFVMFGAGMGHWPGHGHLTTCGRYQVIENIHERIGDFVLRVGGPGVDHTLVWRGTHVSLSELAAGQAVLVSVRPVRLGRHPIAAPACPGLHVAGLALDDREGAE